MRRRFLAISLAFATASALSLRAQDKPNFSGQWTFDHGSGEVEVIQMPAGTKSHRKADPVLGNEVTIKQDEKAFTIDRKSIGGTAVTIFPDGSRESRPQPGKSYTLTYALDGSESKNKIPNSVESTSKVTWDGTTLILTIDSQGHQFRRTFQIQPDGTLLVEHTPLPAGDPSLTVKSVYKKRPA